MCNFVSAFTGCLICRPPLRAVAPQSFKFLWMPRTGSFILIHTRSWGFFYYLRHADIAARSAI
jgi:hypothetical protein